MSVQLFVVMVVYQNTRCLLRFHYLKFDWVTSVVGFPRKLPNSYFRGNTLNLYHCRK